MSEHPRSVMRHLPVLFATLTLAACSTAPVTRPNSRPESRPQLPAVELENTSIDSVIQFLLTAAATDFHRHSPPDLVRFRDVRLGHLITAGGEKQYLLCGEFLPAQERGNAVWTHFATIRTDPYEQWLGAQAAGICRNPSVTWDTVSDLSSSLQNRLDSLR